MKTKIIIGSLLAVIMLVIVPVLTITVTETTAEKTTPEETTSEETKLEETTAEETTSEETTSEETTVKKTPVEETTAEHTEYIPFGFIKASFSGVHEEDFDYHRGLLCTNNIYVNSKSGTLTTPLKINGKTIVESQTPVTLEIKLMSPLGFKPHMTSLICWTSTWHLGLSGFALGITVTY